MGAFLSSLGSAAAGFGKNLVKKNWDEIKGKTTPSGGQDANPDPSIQNAPASNQEELPDTLSPLGIAYHAEGGKLDPNKVNVVGEKGPEVIVGDRVFSSIPNLYHQAKALIAPDPSIDKSLMEKQQNVANYEAGPVSAAPQRTAYVPPKGSGRYGDKPGEQRIDTTEMDKPLGVAHHAEGGELDPNAVNVVGEEGPEEVAGNEVIPNPSTATGTPKMKPFGGVEAPAAPKATEAAKAPDPMKDIADQRNAQAQDTAAQRAQLHQDKTAAASKGDLVGLGMAKIHEKELNKQDAERMVMNEATAPPTAGGGLPPAVTSALQAPVEKPTLAPVMEQDASLATKRAELKQQMESPDQIISGTARRQLAELDQQNPYGSTENHPGKLGKIEHGLAEAGNIAGNIVAPGIMQNIPGTDLNRKAEENRGEAEVKEGETNKLAEAQAKAVVPKAALAQEKQNEVEENNRKKDEAALAKAGYMRDPEGAIVPQPYDQLSEIPKAKIDLQNAQENAATTKANIAKAMADPTSPKNRELLARAKAEVQRASTAAAKLGLDAAKQAAELYGTDEKGNPLPGISTDEKGRPIGTKVAAGNAAPSMRLNKADLSQNVQKNIKEIDRLIDSDPTLFGKVAGRITNASVMAGSDDPAIRELHVAIHNTALASTGVHGLRSAQAVMQSENEILNHFHDSPEATKAGLKELSDSVQTFIDAAKAGKKVAPTPTAPELIGHKVGDTITQGGKTYTVTAVDKDGRVTSAK